MNKLQTKLSQRSENAQKIYESVFFFFLSFFLFLPFWTFALLIANRLTWALLMKPDINSFPPD